MRQAFTEDTQSKLDEGPVFQGLSGWTTHFVVVTGICWSLFQLALASFLILDSLSVRAIHLGFAFLIVFFAYVPRPPARGTLGASVGHKGGIIFTRSVLGIAACISAIYIVIDYHGIASRQGVPLTRDLLVGGALLVLLLEAGRRAIGPALPIISGVFLLYALFGNHLPDLLAFKGVSVERLMGQITMSTEGIYGIPLDVSANIVFLFVLFGAMLEKAGAGDFFIRLSMSLLGGLRGGPAKAAVLASGLTGMVSGSSIANVVTTGTFTIPLMKKVGYPPTKAAAIEVAASTDGQLAPPVMGAAAFIMAEYLNIPYVEVVRHAVVPALVSYLALLFIAHVEALKLGIRRLTPEETPRFRDALVGGVHYLIPIAVLVAELVVYRHSPQLAAFRAIVVLAVIMLIQFPVTAVREGRPAAHGLKIAVKTILESLAAGGRNMVPVAVATACAGIIVGVVTLGLGGLVTEIISRVSVGNLHVMLFVTAAVCLIIGMGLPTTATYVVIASLAAPAMVTIGRSQGFEVPPIAAHMFCFYFGILADETPPVGLASYAAAAIAGSPPIVTGLQSFAYHIRTGILPFMFVYNHELLLIGVDTVPHGVLVVVTATVGAMAFVSATQGWFVTTNRWYEIPLLLVVTLAMMCPSVFVERMGLPGTYSVYATAAALYGGVYLAQKLRTRGTASLPSRFAKGKVSGGNPSENS